MQAGLVSGVKIIYEQDDRHLCRQVCKECSRGVEKPQLVLLRITGTEAFEMSDRIFAGRPPLLYQVAIECLDEWLIRQLPFLLVDSTIKRPHSSACRRAQHFTCQ